MQTSCDSLHTGRSKVINEDMHVLLYNRDKFAPGVNVWCCKIKASYSYSVSVVNYNTLYVEINYLYIYSCIVYT